jgi:hypothetical protein
MAMTAKELRDHVLFVSNRVDLLAERLNQLLSDAKEMETTSNLILTREMIKEASDQFKKAARTLATAVSSAAIEAACETKRRT